MAKLHGIPGESARVWGTYVGMIPLFCGLFAAGFGAAVTLLGDVLYGALLLVAAAVLIVWSFLRGVRTVERYFKGARGEEKVAGVLALLPENYHVFNDFRACGEHVDHVVIGPAGVFAVETKCWSGTITIEDGHILVNGRLPRNATPLKQVVREAKLVRRQMAEIGWKGAVTPVLAFASNNFAAHRAELDGTVILNANELLMSFDTPREVIHPAELARLVSLMESNS